jgi:hypothetical protein
LLLFTAEVAEMNKEEGMNTRAETRSCKVGLFIHFNNEVLEDGIQKVAHNFPDPPRARRPLR